MKTILMAGFGFCAEALAKVLPRREWHVIGTTRDAKKCQELAKQNVEALHLPAADLTQALTQATHLLISAAPSEKGDPFLTQYRELLETASHLRWVGYLSTTGVYGDHRGAWVDESTALTPSTKRGMLRVKAERDWQGLDLPLHIFRLAGIYGPGRGPFEKIRNGTARRILKDRQIFSRIHVEDIAATLLASIQRPRAGAIYNLCDDEPAPPEDVIAYAAKLLGRPIPPSEPFETAEMTEMARSFYAESKRVKNELIKRELGINLRYPNYRDGLKALLDATSG